MRSKASEGSFDEFYRSSAPRIWRHINALTGDAEDARDIVAEAFARAWARWPAVSKADAPEAWVRTVAHRLAISNWRKARNRRTAHVRLGMPAAVPGPSDDGMVLTAALTTLPEKHRRAIVLHYFADLSVEQIAAEMGSPPGSVKVWLSRGRADLARVLAAPGAAPADERPQ